MNKTPVILYSALVRYYMFRANSSYTILEFRMDSAQGSAPVFSPCGIAGGNPFGVEGCEGGEDDFCTWGGYQYGPDARTIDLKAMFLSVFGILNSSI